MPESSAFLLGQLHLRIFDTPLSPWQTQCRRAQIEELVQLAGTDGDPDQDLIRELVVTALKLDRDDSDRGDDTRLPATEITDGSAADRDRIGPYRLLQRLGEGGSPAPS